MGHRRVMSITWVSNEFEALALLRARDPWDTLTRCIKGLPFLEHAAWNNWQVRTIPPPEALHLTMVLEHKCLNILRKSLAVLSKKDGREKVLRQMTDVKCLDVEEMIKYFNLELKELASFIKEIPEQRLKPASKSERVLQQGLFLAGICTEGQGERLIQEVENALDVAISKVQKKFDPPKFSVTGGGLDIHRAALAYDLFRPNLQGLFTKCWQEWSAEVCHLWKTASALATLCNKE